MTLRAVRGLPSLRSANAFGALRRGIAAASSAVFRIVHFSVQSNHLHLLVEAESKHALSRGMQGLGIRLAKAVNHLIGRHGRVWGDRYHARDLRTPREVRNGLIYVLLNARKHGVAARGLDPCSSGAWFDGWREGMKPLHGARPVRRARTWLLCVGWRRSGDVSIDARPAAAGP